MGKQQGAFAIRFCSFRRHTVSRADGLTLLTFDPSAAAHKAATKADGRFWSATSPGKRWTEVFFLLYSPFWIIWALCILVPFKLYDVNARAHKAHAHAPYTIVSWIPGAPELRWCCSCV